jgi:hypothetical protein
MRVLVLCETSHVVSGAFRKCGHDAYSLDLLPPDHLSDTPFHIQMDMRDFCLLMKPGEWDFVVAHPTCTYLTSSAAWAFSDPDYERYPGVGYHQKVKPGTLVGMARRAAKQKALADVRMIMALPVERIAIENPRGCIGTNIDAREYGFRSKGKTATIQPHQFGADASKTTDLFLKNLPDLIPTENIDPRWVDGKPRWGNQTDSGQSNVPPSCDRWKHRSKTFPGVGAAMAVQWGAA